MNYPRIFFILGLIVILVPFLGIPLIWKHVLTVIVGAVFIAFAILLRSALRGAKSNRTVVASRSITTRKPRKNLVSGIQTRAPLSTLMTEASSEVSDYSEVEEPNNLHDES